MPDDMEKGLLQFDPDRRRSPRFSCGGFARIICLPSDGLSLPARVRDLSLGGCGVETASALECGARAEILLNVSGSSVRALGQVRAVRRSSGIGIQFLQLSAGGQDILLELIRELARQQAIASTVRAARSEPDEEFIARRRAELLNARFAGMTAIVGPEGQNTGPIVVARPALIVDGELDLLI